MSLFKKFVSVSPEIRRNVVRRVVIMAFFDALIGLILFLAAGTMHWLYAWLYIAAYLLIQLAGSFFLPLEVLAERGRKKANTEHWDRTVTRLLLANYLSVYCIAGLDRRWQWSPQWGTAWHFAAMFLFLQGCALEMWAMGSNPFFSTDVRIQSERGHRVCDTGPYQYVRHPGYAGMILYILVTPVFLGSLWTFIPALLCAVLFVIRTALEDKTLQSRLPGYKEYASRVRYCLLPGVW